ncbi:hypothetical protein [Nocardia noduli]|uniref:hypothetical protein n=1 Tax=Nocardia noduli TaxID=2815722 RepID=UPI001C21D10A|nr:hypothetical protein [Nocardia noduli]
MAELVALVRGVATERRSILEWAGRYVGPQGLVHVVCDASRYSHIASSLAMHGITYDVRQLEQPDFLQAAAALADYRCGWRWHYAPVAARATADTIARRHGLPVVLSRRGILARSSVCMEYPHAGRAGRIRPGP